MANKASQKWSYVPPIDIFESDIAGDDDRSHKQARGQMPTLLRLDDSFVPVTFPPDTAADTAVDTTVYNAELRSGKLVSVVKVPAKS